MNLITHSECGGPMFTQVKTHNSKIQGQITMMTFYCPRCDERYTLYPGEK